VTVFVARELAADPCRHAAVREHELLHVAVYESILEGSPRALATTLEGALGGHTFGGTSAAAAQADIEAAVTRHLDAFLGATGQAARVRQASVDTPQEYARVETACAGPRAR
jgi:hypothetical protein